VLKRLESLADKAHNGYHCLLHSFRSRTGIHITLFLVLWCVMLWGGLLMKFSKEKIMWVSQLFLTFFFSSFNWVQPVNELERTLFSCLLLIFERFFFLTLDGIAFDHFLPVRMSLSYVNFAHLFRDFSLLLQRNFLYNCQFLFQQQSSLVRF
jgi:hypothetical protein